MAAGFLSSPGLFSGEGRFRAVERCSRDPDAAVRSAAFDSGVITQLRPTLELAAALAPRLHDDDGAIRRKALAASTSLFLSRELGDLEPELLRLATSDAAERKTKTAALELLSRALSLEPDTMDRVRPLVASLDPAVALRALRAVVGNDRPSDSSKKWLEELSFDRAEGRTLEELVRLAARAGLRGDRVIEAAKRAWPIATGEELSDGALFFAIELGESADGFLPAKHASGDQEERFALRDVERVFGAITNNARRTHPTVGREFLELLADRRAAAGLRVAAARSVGRLPRFATESVPVLEQALDEWSPRIRAAAARALGALSVDATSSVPALGDALGDVDSRVRAAACVALGRIGGKASEHATRMAELLGDSSRIVRRDAAIGLGELGPRAPSECLDALIARLEDDAEGDSEVRRRVVEALGLMAAPRRDVVEELRRVREEEGLGPVAKTALERLGIDSNGESSAAPTER